MNDPRHPMQPAPTGLPRATPGATPGSVAAPAVARPLSAPHTVPAHPAHPQHPVAPSSPGGLRPAPQGIPRPGAAPQINPAAPQINPTVTPKPQDDDAIALVEDLEEEVKSGAPAPSKITFGADLSVKKHAWKRQPRPATAAPVRVKTFHAKLSDQGLEYLDEAVNVFLDDHPEVDVKFVTTNVGLFDGKFKDIALIVNVWY